VRSLLKRAKLVALVLLIALVIVVILQNTETVKTRLTFVEVSMPRALLLAVCLLIGFAGGLLFAGRMSAGKDKAKS
jgi:uncharacterized integral membrane protein